MVANKKTVGIISFHRSHNCGSIMQAYALQKVISGKYNAMPEFLDFSNSGQKEVYSILKSKITLKSQIKNIVALANYTRLSKNNRSYSKYIDTHLPLSKEKYTELKELSEASPAYDLYLAGSDQVWNITIQDSDDAYFLPFIRSHTKIAYAVSQGAKNIVEHTYDINKYKKMIGDFDYLSVREPNGQKWLKEGFGIDSQLVLDPTLLLDQKDYSEAEEPSEESLKKNQYIFVYATQISKDQELIIQRTAKEKGLKIVVWQPETWLKKFGWLKGYILPKSQNPGKYLTLMKNAKYVFTASYHGVIFATQYRKNFWVLQNNGMNLETDDRILSLLYRFGFKHRLLRGGKQDIDISLPIDYEEFESKLIKDRKKSFKFLDKALK